MNEDIRRCMCGNLYEVYSMYAGNQSCCWECRNKLEKQFRNQIIRTAINCLSEQLIVDKDEDYNKHKNFDEMLEKLKEDDDIPYFPDNEDNTNAV
jgi:uncharacterized membrane protein YgaE (UPF0421/DUF939 family)